MVAPQRSEDVVTLKPPDIRHLFVILVNLSGQRASMTADHQRGGERPRLGGVISYLAHLDTGLFLHFAAHGFLDGLALVHESRQCRVCPRARQPAPTLPEQAALAIG